MNGIKHPSLVNLVNQLIERAPEVKSYTANRQDPTLVTIQGLEISKRISMQVINSGGSELEIRVGGRVFVDLYMDEDGIFPRQPLTRTHFKYMRSIVKRFAAIERVQYDDCDYPGYYE